LVLANIFGALACALSSKFVARICQIPAQKLVPFILVILIMGAYQANRHWGDIIFFIMIGMLGWLMKHLDWPRPPLIIGFVLSTAIERYLWISMSFHGFAWLTHPGVIIIGLITRGLQVEKV
jgi:TctA family transporter